MKKTKNYQDEYNLFKKQNKESQFSSISGDSQKTKKISKIEYFTGSNSSRIQRQYQAQQKKKSDQSCSIVLTENSKQNQREDSQTKDSKQLSNKDSKLTTMAELQNQIERLTTQLTIKNCEIKQINKNHEKKKGQVVQLQKMVAYYQGRIDYMEIKLKNYQECFHGISKQCDQRSKYKSQVQELVNLFQGMRKQNQILNGKYQQKSFQLSSLSQKYLSLKHKYRQQKKKIEQIKFSTHTSSSSKQVNKLKSSSTSSLRQSSLFSRNYQPSETQKERQNNIKLMNCKIQKIQREIEEVKKQNQILTEEIQGKDIVINNLGMEIRQLRDKIKRQRRSMSRSANKLKYLDRNMKKQGQIRIQPKLKNSHGSHHQYYPHNSNAHYSRTRSSYMHQKNRELLSKMPEQISTVFRKVLYNLTNAGQQFSHEGFIKVLAMCIQDPHSIVFMTNTPYNLQNAQVDKILKYVKDKLQEITTSQLTGQQLQGALLRIDLPQIIWCPPSRTLSLKTSIYNTLQNREEEMVGNMMEKSIYTLQEMEKYLENWGLTDQQIAVLFKAYYEMTGIITEFQLENVAKCIGRWKDI